MFATTTKYKALLLMALLATLLFSCVLGQDNEMSQKSEKDNGPTGSEALLKGSKYSWLKSSLGTMEMFVYKTVTASEAKDMQNESTQHKLELKIKAETLFKELSDIQSDIFGEFMSCPVTDVDKIVDDCQAFLHDIIDKNYPNLHSDERFQFGYWSSDLCKNLLKKMAEKEVNKRSEYAKDLEEGKDVSNFNTCDDADKANQNFIKAALSAWRAFKLVSHRSGDHEYQVIANQLSIIKKEVNYTVNAMEYLCMEYGKATDCGVNPVYNGTTCAQFERLFDGSYWRSDNDVAVEEVNPDGDALGDFFGEDSDDDDDEAETVAKVEDTEEDKGATEEVDGGLVDCNLTEKELYLKTRKYIQAIKQVEEKYHNIMIKESEMNVAESLLKPALGKYNDEVNALSKALGL